MDSCSHDYIKSYIILSTCQFHSLNMFAIKSAYPNVVELNVDFANHRHKIMDLRKKLEDALKILNFLIPALHLFKYALFNVSF